MTTPTRSAPARLPRRICVGLLALLAIALPLTAPRLALADEPPSLEERIAMRIEPVTGSQIVPRRGESLGIQVARALLDEGRHQVDCASLARAVQ